ncbi:hypothetical protein BJ742DRAFT_846519 [Cladochytrium replicatum]|nr:hypothetical protein BJ742DRAFT_846519 [Cladochytrium replicatum]
MSSEGVMNNSLAAIIAYCMSSILMTVTNKLVLDNFKFRMNFMLLCIQSLVAVILLEVFVKFGLVTRRPYRNSAARQWFIVSLALVAMIYTGSKALQYLSIPVFTIFKNLTIILIAYGELLYFGGAPVTPLIFGSFCLMVTSSLIAGWADISAGKIYKDGADTVPFTVSYGWMVANCFASAFNALIIRWKIKEVGFKDFDTVFYNNLLSIPILLFASLLTEGREFAIIRKRYSAENDEGGAGLTALLTGIAVSGISGFAISYGSTWCVRVTSSTTYSMVGALNKLPIAVAGMVFFDAPITFGSVSSVLIAFFAGIAYTIAKNRQKAESMASQRTSILPLSAADSYKDNALASTREDFEKGMQATDGLLKNGEVLFDADNGANGRR